MNYSVFYREFGKMLYAIAKADGAIQLKELEEVHKIIKEDLAPLEESVDEFGTDKAFYAEFQFEIMEEADENVENALYSFLSYVKSHKEHLSPKLKKICINAVEKVAMAYKGTNKVEQFMIDVLKKELKAL
jgi:uncharacterized tellurite resistance protein B-like protein